MLDALHGRDTELCIVTMGLSSLASSIPMLCKYRYRGQDYSISNALCIDLMKHLLFWLWPHSVKFCSRCAARRWGMLCSKDKKLRSLRATINRIPQLPCFESKVKEMKKIRGSTPGPLFVVSYNLTNLSQSTLRCLW